MLVKNINSELKDAPIDDKAGIKLVKITGDDEISIYAADISPNTSLNPHYHKVGIETYQILEGKGLMKIGELKNDKVQWTETFEASEGDCFSISEYTVHQIINHTNYNLRAIFSCASSHVGDDRYFVNE